MSFIVYGIEPIEACRSLVDYFDRKRMKVLSCHEPSIVRVEFGSLVSLGASNRKGKADFTIIKRNGSSSVNLNFDFFTTYGLGLIIGSIAAMLAFAIGLTMSGLPVYTQVIPGSMALLAFVFVMAVTDFSVSETEEKFVDELSAFLDSLSEAESRLIRRLENSNST